MSKTDGIGTWVWNETINLKVNNFDVEYSSNGVSYKYIISSVELALPEINTQLNYGQSDIDNFLVYESTSGWINQSYRTINITSAPPADFLTILQANATYQEPKLTDLTGTTWVWNETISDEITTNSLSFSSNNSNYIGFQNNSFAFSYILLGGSNVPVYQFEIWQNEAYRTISITGGTDATNTELIDYLYANAVLQSSAPPEPTTYPVKVNITYGVLVGSAPATVEQGGDFSITVDAEQGYELNDSGITVTGATYQRFSSDTTQDTPRYQIFFTNVTGDVTVNIVLKAITYPVIVHITNGVIVGSAPATVELNGSFSITLDANQGYELTNSGVQVTGATFDRSSVDSSQSPVRYQVFVKSVTGNVDVTINLTPISYFVTVDVTNGTVVNAPTTIEYGGSFTVTIEALPRYEFNENNIVLSGVTYQRYTVDGQRYQMFFTKVTGRVSISIALTFIPYNITTVRYNCYSYDSNPTTIDKDGTATLKFTAKSGYYLPDNVTVTNANVVSWNKSTGTLVINNPTDDITITIRAIEIVMEDNSYAGVGNNNNYVPNMTQTYFNEQIKLNYDGIIALANVLISPPILESIFFQKPAEWLSGLTFYPIDVFGSDNTGNLRIGTVDTNVPCTEVLQVVYFNLGEYLYKPRFNNFADYNGYTKLKVQLPYYGEVEIMPNDVINKYIQFRLRVDYNSGQAVYFIGVSDTSIPAGAVPPAANDDGYKIRVLSQHAFQLGVQIPLGSTNAGEIYRNIIMGAVKAIGDVTSAYTLSATGSTGGTSVTKTVKTARNKKTGRQVTTATKTQTTTYDASSYQKGRAISACFDVATDSLNAMQLSVTTDKPNMSVLLNNLSSSIIITRYTPKILPVNENYAKLYGYPVGDTYQLSQLSGYTEVTNIHFEDSYFNSATSDEYALIEQAFTDGVILP